MPHRNSLLIGTLLLLLAITPCAAQQSLTLTLEAAPTLSDLIKEALRANPEIVAAARQSRPLRPGSFQPSLWTILS